MIKRNSLGQFIKGCKFWLGKKRLSMYGKNNWNWKGNEVGNDALHSWVERQLGFPKKCEHCNTTKSKSFQWANKSGKYKRNLKDWLRLCIKCHHRYDNKSVKIWEARRRNGTDKWRKK